MKRNAKLVVLMAFMLAFTVCASSGLAEDTFPSKPITMIDPWSPGGGCDIMGRILASVAAENLGQPIIMKYITGGSGVRGAEALTRANADGYTTATIAYGAIINQTVSQPDKAHFGKDDFVWVCQVSAGPCVLVANPKAPFKTIPEMVEYVKKNPGKIIYSSSGRFGFVHTAWARLIRAMGIEGKMIHLPTRGGGPAMKECLGGHALVTGGTPAVSSQHIQAGTVIPLGTSDDERWPLLKQIPTVKEVIGKEISPTTLWIAIAVPKGTPPDRVEFLREGFKKIMDTQSVQRLMARTGDVPKYMSGPDFQKKFDREWAEGKDMASLLLEK